MVTINLLPEKAKVAGIIRNYVLLGMIIYGVAFAGFFLLRAKAAAKLMDLEIQKAKVMDELASPRLKQIVAEVKKFTQSKETLSKSAEVLKNLRERQAVWINILDLMPDVLPAKATIVSIKSSKKSKTKGATSVELQVFGLDREVIPDLYTALEVRQEISNVSIKSIGTSSTSFGEQAGRKFTVTFDYLGA